MEARALRKRAARAPSQLRGLDQRARKKARLATSDRLFSGTDAGIAEDALVYVICRWAANLSEDDPAVHVSSGIPKIDAAVAAATATPILKPVRTRYPVHEKVSRAVGSCPTRLTLARLLQLHHLIDEPSEELRAWKQRVAPLVWEQLAASWWRTRSPDLIAWLDKRVDHLNTISSRRELQEYFVDTYNVPSLA